jgi:hypothetical protein
VPGPRMAIGRSTTAASTRSCFALFGETRRAGQVRTPAIRAVALAAPSAILPLSAPKATLRGPQTAADRLSHARLSGTKAAKGPDASRRGALGC